MEYFVDALKKYVEFNGRARRKAFWMYVLIYFLIAFAVSIVEAVISGATGTEINLISALLTLGLLLPSLAIGARRLHDIGHSGWWQLIGIIPLVGFIVLIIFYVRDSQPGDNEYGPNPKQIEGT